MNFDINGESSDEEVQPTKDTRFNSTLRIHNNYSTNATCKEKFARGSPDTYLSPDRNCEQSPYGY